MDWIGFALNRSIRCNFRLGTGVLQTTENRNSLHLLASFICLNFISHLMQNLLFTWEYKKFHVYSKGFDPNIYFLMDSSQEIADNLLSYLEKSPKILIFPNMLKQKDGEVRFSIISLYDMHFQFIQSICVARLVENASGWLFHFIRDVNR